MFGATPQQSAFGSTPAHPQQTSWFGGNQQQPQQQQASAFGGVQSSQASTGWFGGGTSQAQPTSTFGSTTAQPQSGGLFGAAPQQQQQSTAAFGVGQTGQTGGSIFGTGTGSLFGASQQQSTSFGQQPQQTGTGFGTSQPSSFSGFGGGGNLFQSQQQKPFSFGTSFGQPQPSVFSQPQQQQQQQQQFAIDEQAAFHQSIFGCCKFGDERDAILANLNFVQACWGAGKGFYNQSHPPVVFNDKNVFYRFKAVGYSFMYNDSNEDGQVVIRIKKPHTKVRDEETQFINTLQTMIAKPNIFFKITGSKALSEDMSVIVLIAEDRTSLRRILATDLAGALAQQQLKPQLDNLGIVDVCPKVKPSPEQLKAYLENPPAGLDPRVWKKAQEDNPDSANMIPIPLVGPDALKNRLDAQTKEVQQHQERLKLISDEVSSLNNRHANISAELVQMRRRHTVLSHRIVSAILRLQMLQRQGLPVQSEEEALKKQFEELDKQLNSPKHFRGRMNELMSHVRLHKTALETRGVSRYTLDPDALEQIKVFLNLQQDSIKHLVDTVKTDVEYVQRMLENVTEFHGKALPS